MSRWDRQKRLIRVFHQRVLEHTREVRDKFGRVGGEDLELHSREKMIEVLVEEVGKLARSSNKMALAADDGVLREWQAEWHHRLVTIGSVVARIASTLPASSTPRAKR